MPLPSTRTAPSFPEARWFESHQRGGGQLLLRSSAHHDIMKISINPLHTAMLSVVVVTVFAAMSQGTGRGSPATEGDEYCQPPPLIETEVSPGTPPQVLVEATVPSTAPDLGKESSNVDHAFKGDVIGVNVSTLRPGSIAVHGLLDTKQATVGATSSGSFRAIYTGSRSTSTGGWLPLQIAVVETVPRDHAHERRTVRASKQTVAASQRQALR